MAMSHFRRCLWLFGINLYISAFTFGGGYVVVPMIRKYFVDGKNLFSEEELMDMAAVAQSTPGAIAINLSALSGLRTAGFAGAAVSSAAAILPPLLILSAISGCYTAFSTNPAVAAVLRGMQAGVAALIVDLVIDMTRMILRERLVFFSLMVPAAFIAASVFRVSAALSLTVCCCLCLLRVCLHRSCIHRGRIHRSCASKIEHRKEERPS